MTTAEHKVVGAVNDFLAAAGDTDERHASINRYLSTIFNEITPGDLTAAEASALVEAFEPAFLRVTGTTVNDGAAGAPHVHQLGEILKQVNPWDLTAGEALLILTLLIPAHSRVIIAQADGSSGRPVQRLLLHPVD